MDDENKHRIYVGIIWDKYTPSVEGQLLRDCLGLQQTASRTEEIVLVCQAEPKAMLNILGIRIVPTTQLAKMWILYKTEEYWPEAPEWATTTVQRDLWVKPGLKDRLIQVDSDQGNGYYLPPQGRLSPDTLSLERPAPNGYIPVDPAQLAIWS